MNTMKTMVLMVTMTLLLIWVGGMIGGKSGMTFALIVALGMNFFSYWFSDKIILRVYGATEVDKYAAPQLYDLIRRLAVQGNLPMPKVYIIHQEQPNAFATGRNPKNAAVAVTSGILKILSLEELEGVIGHELAHIKHRDILISTIVATIAGAISFLAQMAQWSFIFGAGRDEDGDSHPLAALVMMIVGPIAAMLIQMAISRSREYAADQGGARIAGNPRNLAKALYKLNTLSKEIPLHANPATAHMFIVSPLTGGGITKLFSTHPPIEDRIERLNEMTI